MCAHKPLHTVILHRYFTNNLIILLHTVPAIIFLTAVTKNWNFKRNIFYTTLTAVDCEGDHTVFPPRIAQCINILCPVQITTRVNVTTSKTNHTLCTIHDHYYVFFSKITTAQLTFLNYPRCGLKFLISLATRSKTWACRRLHPGIAVSNPIGAWTSLFDVVCWHVEVVASVWSLIQRSPTECDVSECNREASIVRRPWPTGGGGVRDFRSCAGEGFIRVAYDTVAMGNRIPTFQGIVITSCSKAELFSSRYYWYLNMRAVLSS